jgi:N utilization substance protein A
MRGIKFDVNTIKYMSMFETLTRAKPKDCFFDSNQQLVFVIEQGNMARAIGKNGSNVKKLERTLKRKIKIVEFNPDVLKFVSSLIAPVKAKEIKIDNKTVTIVPADLKTRGLLIGKGARNLKNFENITKKYFDISEIKVI